MPTRQISTWSNKFLRSERGDNWYPPYIHEMDNPSELWLKSDHEHDLAFRPLESELHEGTVTPSTPRPGPSSTKPPSRSRSTTP